MTIAVDTSALVAVLLREPEADRLLAVMRGADRLLVGAPSVFELRLVLRRTRDAHLDVAADLLLSAPHLEIVPWSAEHLPLAQEALTRFGGRPARLNFGDCMAYAVAKAAGCPLLYKGGDFAATDVRSAL